MKQQLAQKSIWGIVSWLIVICVSGAGAAQTTAKGIRYFPQDVRFDPAIPRPEQHLGFRIGERHLQHHQLVSYLKLLARKSKRVKIQVYAYSHGHRPCVMLTITSPGNHQRLETIRKQHLRLTRPEASKNVRLDDLPAVINMGYGVHGDESSASNASVLVAWYLAAAQGKSVDRILKDCVVLLDPCLNPDGFDRFASWANGHVGRVQNPDPNHREHVQPFPGGRVNYYWFDLNRDWLPAQHPESQGRLRLYHQWKPNVVLDFHEMGTNSTYFFQPGIPTRNNPLTPQRNLQLTRKMACFHAKALDRIGSLYMTEERFDDFYMGKGSTYPDLHGSVGILFEQASSRGHRQESIHGVLTFPFTIRNHVTTSLSSLDATTEMRKELLVYKREFYRDSLKQAREDGNGFFEFRCPGDVSRLLAFAEVLLRHDLRVFLDRSGADCRLIVPRVQPEYRFLLSLTEKRTDFRENIFYDVSTWHLPSAFGVESKPLQEFDLAGKKTLTLRDLASRAKANVPAERSGMKALAYLIDWRSQDAAPLVGKLLRQGVRVRTAMSPFTAIVGGRKMKFPHGTIMIPLGIQTEKADRIRKILTASSAPIHAVDQGLTPEGIDLGSSRFAAVEKLSVAMLAGKGVSRYEAGEVWHLMDTRLRLPLTMIDTADFGQTDLGRYNSLILVSGSYSALGETGIGKIREWVRNGGNLILLGSAVQWAGEFGLVKIKLRRIDDSDSDPDPESASESDRETDRPKKGLQAAYDQARSRAALELISGAIFETSVDRTHPLGFGFSRDRVRVFRNNRVVVEPDSVAHRNVAVYEKEPLVAGYCSQRNRKYLSHSAAVIGLPQGKGNVVVVPQNPNFRGFWYGTNRFMINALFFGKLAR